MVSTLDRQSGDPGSIPGSCTQGVKLLKQDTVAGICKHATVLLEAGLLPNGNGFESLEGVVVMDRA